MRFNPGGGSHQSIVYSAADAQEIAVPAAVMKYRQHYAAPGGTFDQPARLGGIERRRRVDHDEIDVIARQQRRAISVNSRARAISRDAARLPQGDRTTLQPVDLQDKRRTENLAREIVADDAHPDWCN